MDKYVSPATSPYLPPKYGPVPVIATCPSCHCRITSRVETEASARTHILALLLCSFCCCCLPYCMGSCKNKNHYCTNCGAYLGTFKS
ncbi:hypothetical protein ILUMI_15783 [Ignelater luminosus]|uniref:LITAF domain-containing protein n=1 Tax=Ignelater luminosus TaxID=2038154 RepID=A0A8K0CN15_IGNLU|nr:hypothetical protein ILUMI_15783 [Ignelater luminosus]